MKRKRTITGLSKTREYLVWRCMIRRCYDPKDKVFHHYGGRGITVSDRWRDSFINFLVDMGQAPSGYTLERNNNDIGYDKANCRWATMRDQARNKRSNRLLTLNGVTLCQTDWAEKIGITHSALSRRMSQGWAIERALTTPKQGV